MDKGSGDLRERSHSDKLSTCEKELKKNLSNEENIWNRKLIKEYFNKGAKFQSQQEVGKFSHVVLTLVSRIEERGCGI